MSSIFSLQNVFRLDKQFVALGWFIFVEEKLQTPNEEKHLLYCWEY